jgi:DNA polymerase III sliding clamp (beta) subunit (PCNA family)
VENARLAINASKGGHRRRFLLPVLEPLEDGIPEPKILFKASGRILTQAMRRAIRDANLVSENIKLEISEDAFKLSATGDIGSAYSEWEKDSDELLELKAEEEVTATYTLSYLTNMFNALNPLCDVVIIESSTDMPCRIKADGVPHIEADLYLAPCIGV